MTTDAQLDPRRIRRNFARAAGEYAERAVLAREVCTRMLERLDLVKLSPATILDAGSGTGWVARAMVQRYPGARVLALDWSRPMLLRRPGRASFGAALRSALGAQRGGARVSMREVLRADPVASVCADFEHLPLRTGSIDMVVSNFALHWSNAPSDALAEMQRVLRRGGLLMFATLGPDTLAELAHASAAAGASVVHRFVDMHDLGDMLVHSGFADPVMDMEYLTLTYVDVEALFRDLRGSGAMSARAGRNGLHTPRWRERVTQSYERFRREGRLPATFEIIYGHAWKPEQGPRTTADGRAVIQLDLGRHKREAR